MTPPLLTITERYTIDAGPWFSKLPQPLREAIVARAVVRRRRDGSVLSPRGEPVEPWVGVAKGALRIGSIALSGQQTTRTYAEPGPWIGDILLIDGLSHTHDSTAYGDTLQAIAQR